VWKAGSNPGVSARAQKDYEQHKQEEKSLENVEAKLREKSHIYDRFVRGDRMFVFIVSLFAPRAHVSVREDMNEKHREGLMVDFEQKEYERQVTGPDGEFFHSDIQRELERQRWEEEARKDIDTEYAEREMRMEKHRILDQLNEETKVGRDKHKQLEMKRKIAKMSRNDQIKQKIQSRKEKEAAANTQTEEDEDDHEMIKVKKLQLKKPKLDY
jgi:hypothetical protein